jgi:hypothetical protein
MKYLIYLFILCSCVGKSDVIHTSLQDSSIYSIKTVVDDYIFLAKDIVSQLDIVSYECQEKKLKFQKELEILPTTAYFSKLHNDDNIIVILGQLNHWPQNSLSVIKFNSQLYCDTDTILLSYESYDLWVNSKNNVDISIQLSTDADFNICLLGITINQYKKEGSSPLVSLTINILDELLAFDGTLNKNIVNELITYLSSDVFKAKLLQK